MEDENRGLSNRLARAAASDSIPPDQLKELLRLRGEVGLLRRQKVEIEALRADNQRLRSRLTPENTGPAAAATSPEYLPRESWQYAGYGDPESAVQSTFCAWTSGDPQLVVASMTPGFRAAFGTQTDQEIAERLERTAGGMKGFQISKQERLADDCVLLTASLTQENEGPGGKAGFRFKRIGVDP